MGIETILLAVGSGDDVRTEQLSRAVNELAEPTGARIVVAHVFSDEEFADTLSRLNIDAGADPDEVANRHATVRAIVKSLADSVKYDVRGAVGKRAETILSLAEEVGANRIIVGGRKRSPTGKAIFGSTAQEVILNAPCPVTFVRNED